MAYPQALMVALYAITFGLELHLHRRGFIRGGGEIEVHVRAPAWPPSAFDWSRPSCCHHLHLLQQGTASAAEGEETLTL